MHLLILVGETRLELACLSTPDPKSGVSAIPPLSCLFILPPVDVHLILTLGFYPLKRKVSHLMLLETVSILHNQFCISAEQSPRNSYRVTSVSSVASGVMNSMYFAGSCNTSIAKSFFSTKRGSILLCSMPPRTA